MDHSIVQIVVYSFDTGYFGLVSAALDRVSGRWRFFRGVRGSDWVLCG